MEALYMIKELFTELEELHLNDWEESFVLDVYEKAWEEDWEMTPAQEDKVEQIYYKYLG